ncbi:hypothetical protein [Euzebya tangerina]|uniref:hypothetical protein n=1 Tax=Euzebya tangerina TaxID=591198 RepID=UPI000E317598|nr:hypothetical protein [Euzebya tangerina]
MLDDSDEHRPYEDYAVRHVMGSLDESESGAFRSHLLDCSECRARVGELRSIASDLAEVERTERLERAAARVEIKERESEEEVAPPDLEEPPSRSLRAATIAGILLIVVLSVWNFVLRAQNSDLSTAVSALNGAAETVNFGDAWTTEDTALGHEGVARVDDGRLAILVRGTDDDATYSITFFDADGFRLDRDRVRSTGGQVRWFVSNMPASFARAELSLQRGTGDTVIFRASAN